MDETERLARMAKYAEESWGSQNYYHRLSTLTMIGEQGGYSFVEWDKLPAQVKQKLVDLISPLSKLKRRLIVTAPPLYVWQLLDDDTKLIDSPLGTEDYSEARWIELKKMFKVSEAKQTITSLSKEGAQVGAVFLSNLDKFLAQNWKQLRCSDICNIYYQFCDELKMFRGTSTNFTGLSELLVFRFLIHQLGGSFKKQDINKDIAEFTNSNLRIQQGFKLPGMTFRPDITIWKLDKLIGVIQIKAYLSNGFKTFKSEMDIFNRIQEVYPYQFGKLMLIYNTASKPKQLGKEPYINYPFIYLQDEDRLFCETLKPCIPNLP
ncbi:MAG: hypothetical protein C4542_03375 [Dehalococcoidia bacterium]|nr:MAG: hypothetical protein C4542_03375 [Dehalococcoidia bacterium]